jgi:hypothetical protein
MKFLNFLLLLWVIFALLDLDPDPATQINADPDTDLQVHLQAMFSEIKSFLTRIQNKAFCSCSPDMDSNPGHGKLKNIMTKNQSFESEIGSGFNQVSGSRSISRTAKMTHKNRKKLRIFMF